MGKYLNWIKRNILNEKETETKECKKSADDSEEKCKMTEKQKIYISHMDDLFWEAGRIIIENNRASVGMLQRVLKISFNRAARIMSELCEAGIIGEEVETAPKKILIDQKEFWELQYNGLIKVIGRKEHEQEINENALIKYIYPPLSLLRIKIDSTENFGFCIPIRKIFESNEFLSSDFMPFAIGIDIDGNPVINSILDFVKIIIPSNSEYEKLVCINNMIMSILYMHNPEEVKIILTDTGKGDLSVYNGIPHLLTPVVTNTEKSFKALRWLVEELENRDKIFKKYNADNIKEYNYSKEIKYRFSLILVIINNYSQLILQYGEEIKRIIEKIEEGKCEYGIYPIVVEKRLHCTISLGIKESERKFVVVPSRQLMRENKEHTFVQGAFVSNKEILGVVNFLDYQCRKKANQDINMHQTSDRIKMYNNKYDCMTGEDFELFIAQILGGIGFYNIQITKGSGDQGVDIIAEKDSMKYAFQCKRYDKPVGNKAVQEVFAGKFFYHCHVGVVVTNNYFTQAAKDLAHENGIVLWDREYLYNVLNKTNYFLEHKHETKREINEKELMSIAVKIQSVFLSFNIKIAIVDIDCKENGVGYYIQPKEEMRIKTIMSYKEELEIELRVKIQMKTIPEKGCIGIFVPAKYFIKNT